jgi:galactokinase
MQTSRSQSNSAIRSSAPGRANLIGEHIDYAGGVVLPFAISNRTYANISMRNDDLIAVESTHSDGVVTVDKSELATWSGQGWARYPLGVINVFRSMGVDLPGLNIAIDSNVPQGAGVSSSAALECAVAIGLNQLLNLDFSHLELAKISQRAENEYVGMPCGLMDQATSMLAKESHILCFDCLSHEFDYLPFDIESQSLEILLIDSRVKHELVDGGYASRFAACETARTTLNLSSLRNLTRDQFEKAELEPLVRKRVSHVISEMERVEEASAALIQKNFHKVGELMNQSHASLRDQYEVSCVELDLICDLALNNGAIGARMMGGGFGGSAIVLTPSSARESILGHIKEAFQKKGLNSVNLIAATPSQGAHIE